MPRNPNRMIRFDCVAGISGDMVVAALVDLLGSVETDARDVLEVSKAVERTCQTVTRLSVDMVKVRKSGFPASHLRLEIEEDSHHVHVNDIMLSLTRCVDECNFKSKPARDFATRVFEILIEAEKKAHGIDEHDHSSQVHLHELASADTLIDILCATKALEMLGFFDPDCKPTVISTPVAVGRGSIKIAHGIVPIPAPGTLEIIKKYKIPVVEGPVDGELATPTGVALLASMEPAFSPVSIPARVIGVGMGAGTKDFPGLANILRVQLLEVDDSCLNDRITESTIDRVILNSSLELSRDEVVQVSMFIDDASPEDVGFLIRKSYDLGAKEVFNIPVQGKKSRQGNEIQILCDDATTEALVLLWLENSTTIGCRLQKISRIVIQREIKEIPVVIEKDARKFSGNVRLKLIHAKHPGHTIGALKRPLAKVEHDDLERIASVLEISIYEARKLVEEKIKLDAVEL